MTKLTEMKATEEQEAVVEAMSSRESVMVNAYAGCAKTTTLALAGKKVKDPTLALAFNKRIAKELEPRFGGNFSVMTLNGLGHRAWGRALPQVSRMELDSRKLGKIISQRAKDEKLTLSADQWDNARRLVTEVMNRGIVPGDEGNGLLADTYDNWNDAAEVLWITQDDFDFLYEFSREVLIESIRQAKTGIISFDDQIYCSVTLGGVFPQFPTLFVDEAQDLSPLNHAMLKMASRPDAKFVVCGDEKQAIYAFRGASSESMQLIRDTRDSWQDRRLTLTFRCPKTIVARQQKHAPGFSAFHTNAEGIYTGLRFDPEALERGEAGWEWKDVERMRPERGTLAVLCRNNAPLLGLAFKLIRQGVGVVMLGRDIGKGLVTLSKKIFPEDETPADICRELVADWKQTEQSAAAASGHEERVSAIGDRADCLKAVIDSAGVTNAGQLRAALTRLFSQDVGTVTLSTIHRAKGLEWDLVLHLDPWRVPSRYARQKAIEGHPAALQQEYNLLYVCETRSKHTLVTASLRDFWTGPTEGI
jgi:DNA helicase-2/ATP-dependent DNA helicase PcrA